MAKLRVEKESKVEKDSKVKKDSKAGKDSKARIDLKAEIDLKMTAYNMLALKSRRPSCPMVTESMLSKNC